MFAQDLSTAKCLSGHLMEALHVTISRNVLMYCFDPLNRAYRVATTLAVVVVA